MMLRFPVIKAIVCLLVVVWLVVGCGDIFTEEQSDQDGLELPPPTDIMGFVPFSTDTSSTLLHVKWLAEEAENLTGCHVYRTDGTRRYDRLNGEPIPSTPSGCYLFVDQEVEVPSDRQAIYCVTATDEEGAETDPSPFLIVPANATSETVHGLSPGDGQTDVSVTPTFNWEAVDGAESYCITVIEGLDGDGPVIWQGRTFEPRHQFPTDQCITYVPCGATRLNHDAGYTWIVFAIDENNFTFAIGRASFVTHPVGALPPAPTHAMGSFREHGGGLAVGLWWLVADTSELQGCNIYRRIAGGSYERINEELVPCDEIFHDEELSGPPAEEHSYFVTSVGREGVESDPSAEVIVPADFSWVNIHNLSPEDGETGVAVKPRFSWDAVVGAEMYCILVGEADTPDENFVWVYRDSGTSFECGETGGATYQRLETGQLVHETHYTWNILGLSGGNFVFSGGSGAFTTESGGVAPPSPIEIMGSLGDLDGVPTMRVRWSVSDGWELEGCNVYRRIGSGPYAQINEEPYPPDQVFLDQEVGDYTTEELSYFVTAVDLAGMESDPSSEVVVPANFTWASVHNQIPHDGETEVPVRPMFSWDAVDGAETYCILLSESGAPGGEFLWIYRDTGTSFALGQVGGATYIDFAPGQLMLDTEYRWNIRAVDENNLQFANRRAYFTTEVEGMPPPPTDVVGLLSGFGGLQAMGIRWSVSDEGGLLGCNVYRKIGSGPYERINEHMIASGDWYVDYELSGAPGEQHAYHVTAVNVSDLESDPSPEVIVPVGFSWKAVENVSPDQEQMVPVVPTFSWDPVVGAASYLLILHDGSAAPPAEIWAYRTTEASIQCGETMGTTYVRLEHGQLERAVFHLWTVLAVDLDNMAFGLGEGSFQTEP